MRTWIKSRETEILLLQSLFLLNRHDTDTSTQALYWPHQIPTVSSLHGETLRPTVSEASPEIREARMRRCQMPETSNVAVVWGEAVANNIHLSWMAMARIVKGKEWLSEAPMRLCHPRPAHSHLPRHTLHN
ncbi:hypothetical protein BJY01DRAFT_192934 [Aspergillus pseudoustus]|uniref:Uncharacterized protein n=1 Tax=Aspergillus pseudoustus TaxID=1810923 RepID=A0ABR4JUF9_9EURO